MVGSLYQERERVVDWMVLNLFGPVDGLREQLRRRPSRRYLCGILFPSADPGFGLDGLEPEEDDSPDGPGEEAETDTAANEAPARQYYTPPSAMGLSFFASSDIEIEVSLMAGRYETSGLVKGTNLDDDGSGAGGRTQGWQRKPMEENGEWTVLGLGPPTADRGQVKRVKIWENRALVYSIWRPYGSGYLVTVSLANLQKEKSPFPRGWEEACLFQVGLECRPVRGRILPYPATEKAFLEDEELELELQYREHGVFGIGHGAAVDWELNDRGEAMGLKVQFMPRFEAPLVTPYIPGLDDSVLDLSYLAGIVRRPDEVCAGLRRFIQAYAVWIAHRKKEKVYQDAPEHEAAAAARIVERLEKALARMEKGIRLLEEDPRAALAFSLANQAMAGQIKHDRPVWRPFQLGYFLLTLESLAEENSLERDLVDLLWFPTGGGKTEAYLALLAFVVCLRRIRHGPAGGGTTVIMRYTMRLLTTQQFERAARLICALELIRRDRPEDLGTEPITLGLWVGAGVAPNTYRRAAVELDALARAGGGPAPGYILEYCPLCGTALEIPAEGDRRAAGLEWSRTHFRFVCPNRECGLYHGGDGVIPVNLIDEHLYRHPPTLLLATVDKFATLAWKSEPNAFFGRETRPPELIIQDELHLISGELGSVCGVYEAAMDTVIRLKGLPPKYIASTATIRHASSQVRLLYGREVAVFPPPGLSSRDSFFARSVPVDRDHPGRLYLGFMAPDRKRQQALGPLAAVLLTAPPGHSEDPSVRDAWWTLLVYHGSLRGVGNSMNTMQNEVAAGIKDLLAEAREKTGAPEADDLSWSRDITGRQLAQLTSNIGSGVIKQTLSRLEKSWDDTDSVSVLLCTNMISVGVDVGRLALMIVNGQPLTTGEYIQASSRVGRGAAPGLVVAHYFRNQARSLSHYENFRAYHESFYRFVEPTSVTPYSVQARGRALHAALVITLRHGVKGLLGQKEAANLDASAPEVVAALNRLARRCARADEAEAHKTGLHLQQLLEQWMGAIEECRQNRQQLTYDSQDRNYVRLLREFNSPEEKHAWETLWSMRNVDEECGLRIVRPRRPAAD